MHSERAWQFVTVRFLCYIVTDVCHQLVHLSFMYCLTFKRVAGVADQNQLLNLKTNESFVFQKSAPRLNITNYHHQSTMFLIGIGYQFSNLIGDTWFLDWVTHGFLIG